MFNTNKNIINATFIDKKTRFSECSVFFKKLVNVHPPVTIISKNQHFGIIH